MKKVFVTLVIVLGMSTFALLPSFQAVAGSPQRQACEGAGGNWSNGSCNNPSSQGGSLTDIITTIINTLLFIAGIVAVVMIIIGGFRYMTAQGDSSQISSAKNTILYAVIGLVVVITSFAIVNFILDRF